MQFACRLFVLLFFFFFISIDERHHKAILPQQSITWIRESKSYFSEFRVVGQQRVLLHWSKTYFTHMKLLSLLIASFLKYKIMLMKLDGQIILRITCNWTSLTNTWCQSIFSEGRERAYHVATSTHGANYVNITH